MSQKMYQERSGKARRRSQLPTYCQICGRKVENIEGLICLPCLNAESIIVDGLTVLDKGLNGSFDPVSTAFEKVKLLIQEGWQAPNS